MRRPAHHRSRVNGSPNHHAGRGRAKRACRSPARRCDAQCLTNGRANETDLFAREFNQGTSFLGLVVREGGDADSPSITSRKRCILNASRTQLRIAGQLCTVRQFSVFCRNASGNLFQLFAIRQVMLQNHKQLVEFYRQLDHR